MPNPSPIRLTIAPADLAARVRSRLEVLAASDDTTVASAAAVALRQLHARQSIDDDVARIETWWIEQVRHDPVLQSQLADWLPRPPVGVAARGAGVVPSLPWRSPAVMAPLVALAFATLAPLMMRPSTGAVVGGAEPVAPGAAATYVLTTGDGARGLVTVNVRRTSEIERAVGPPGNYLQQLTYLGWPDPAVPTRAWHYVHPVPLSAFVPTFGSPPFLWIDAPDLTGSGGFLGDAAGNFWGRLPLQTGLAPESAFAAALASGDEFTYRASWSGDEMVECPAGRFHARRANEAYEVDGKRVTSVSWYDPDVGLVQRDVVGPGGETEQRWQLINASRLASGALTPERAAEVDRLRGRAAPAWTPARTGVDAWTWPSATAIGAAGGPAASPVTTDLAALAGAATLCQGIVVVPTQAGLVFGLGLTDGNPRWVFGGPGPIDSSPICMDDRLAFTSGGRRLYAVDAASGLYLWSGELPGVVQHPPTWVGDRVVVGTEDGLLAAFETRTGQSAWQVSLGHEPLSAGAVGGEVLFVGDAGKHLWALDPTNGAERWQTKMDGPVTVAPTVAGAAVYVATANGSVDARDAATGDRLPGDWPVSDPNRSRPWPPLVVGDIVFVQQQDGDLLIADRRTGKARGTIGVFDQVPGGIKGAVTGAPAVAPTGEVVVPVGAGAPYVVTVDPVARRVRRSESLVPEAWAGSVLAGSVHSPLVAEGWQVVVVDSFGVDARRWPGGAP